MQRQTTPTITCAEPETFEKRENLQYDERGTSIWPSDYAWRTHESLSPVIAPMNPPLQRFHLLRSSCQRPNLHELAYSTWAVLHALLRKKGCKKDKNTQSTVRTAHAEHLTLCNVSWPRKTPRGRPANEPDRPVDTTLNVELLNIEPNAHRPWHVEIV